MKMYYYKSSLGIWFTINWPIMLSLLPCPPPHPVLPAPLLLSCPEEFQKVRRSFPGTMLREANSIWRPLITCACVRCRAWRNTLPRIRLIGTGNSCLTEACIFMHTCKKRVIPVIYHRKFFWIFRKILGWEREINTAPKPSPEVAPSKMEVAPS